MGGIPGPAVAVGIANLDAPAAFKSGIAAMWQEDLPLAAAYLQAVVDLEPQNAAAHAYLGSVLFASGSIEAGMLASEYALQLDRGGFAPQMKAGEMVLRLGDLDRAADLFLGAMRAALPGSREAIAAKAARTTALRAAGRSIRHGAALPGWLAARLPGGKSDDMEALGLVSGSGKNVRRIDRRWIPRIHRISGRGGASPE
jgi:tetratricopeptide (TPR) repeat protein